eukprot:scaffold51684_cov72-Phaeocystis_antarctica.AAC.6
MGRHFVLVSCPLVESSAALDRLLKLQNHTRPFTQRSLVDQEMSRPGLRTQWGVSNGLPPGLGI